MTGLIGEHTVDDSCWIIKTHHPLRLKFADFPCNKMIICVRDPFDIYRSVLHFLTTKSHSKQMDCDFPVEEPKFMKACMRMFVRKLIEFQDAIFELNKVIPVYLLKFEELVSNPRPLLEEVFKFLLGVENISGTVI